MQRKKKIAFLLSILLCMTIGNISYADNISDYPIVIPSQENIKIDFENSIFDNKKLLNASEEKLPESYDMRKDIAIRVKDQESSQSCWTFSTLSVLETNISRTTGINYDFSERHMNYATTRVFLDGTNPIGYNRHLAGGNPFIGFSYMTRGSGPISENEMPFSATNENLINLADIEGKTVLKKVEDYRLFPQIIKIKQEDGKTIYKNGNKTYSEDEVTNIRNSIKKHIMEYGAVTAVTLSGISANSGVNYNSYYKYGSTYPSYYCDDPKDSANHQITIIGWDDNYSVDNFNIKPSKPGAYLILNSYGINSTYPEGCYYISYEDALIESCPLGVIKVTDIDYDNIYQHDPLGNSRNISLEGYSTLYGANVFTKNTNEDEKLKEISISTLSDVKCEIYVNTKNGNINSSELKKVSSNTITLKSGYTTIKFDEPLILTGRQFVVAVKYMVDRGNVTVGVESPSNSAWATATSQTGESFIGDSLDDMRDMVSTGEKNTNICIKAFTENVNSNITTKDYSINSNNTISKIKPNTKYKDFIGKFTTESTITVHDASNNEIGLDTYIGTGMKLLVGNKPYTLIVTGDLNGDGEINIVDVGFMRQHIIEQRQLISPYLEASDVNQNGRNADIADFGIVLDIFLKLRNNI